MDKVEWKNTCYEGIYQLGGSSLCTYVDYLNAEIDKFRSISIEKSKEEGSRYACDI
jgi:hypothetical protein